jgi:hypothetical protein
MKNIILKEVELAILEAEYECSSPSRTDSPVKSRIWKFKYWVLETHLIVALWLH